MNKIILAGVAIMSLGLVFGFSLLGTSEQLNLSIPIEGMKGHVGKCEVEILNTDDKVVGDAFRFVVVNKDYYTVPMSIKLRKEVDDYDLLRVKVSFKKEERMYSLHQLQDRMIVNILGQDEFVKGTPIRYRVIVRNQRSNEPLSDASVRVVRIKDDASQTMFEGKTDRTGTCQTDFTITDDVENAQVRFDITSDIGKDSYETSIKLISGAHTYLVTDKPIYQPGQTIHIRTLSLRKPDLTAVQGELTFEVEDSKGNKVFKRTKSTDKFGTCYEAFVLADELNFGDYTIRALLHGDKVEKTVKVEKYVLPKFSIKLSTDRDYYLPGERMEGNIDAQYFFGKPVVGGRVKMTSYRYDIGFQKEAVIEGKTDDNGIYHFVYELPEYFVGEPLEKGDAFVRLDIEVIDKANHSEKVSIKKKIVQDVIGLSIVPEGGMLKPNLINRIYVLANYPDGSPCTAQIDLVADGKKMSGTTDEYGIAEFTLTPEQARTLIQVTAKDDKGETASIEKEFINDLDRDQIIMRMPRGIFKVGDRVQVEFLTTKRTGRIYLDIIKDNQTMLTKSVEVHNGKGTYDLTLTTDIAGSIWLHAYIVSPGSDIIRDTRFCFVHAANDLTIDVAGDKNEYLPGEDGKITFTVQDSDGKPRVAALCVAIVDEAVFAVSELQPGLEKVYFMLEKEILEPRYEIHGFEPEAIVQKPGIMPRAENVMFSTLSPKEPFPVSYTTPQEVDAKVRNAFVTKLVNARDEIYAAINKYYAAHNEYPKSEGALETLIGEGYLDEKVLFDPWLRKYRVTTTDQQFYWFTIVSAGPDGAFDTGDDINEWAWGWDMDGAKMLEAEQRAAPVMAAPRASVAGERMKGEALVAKSPAAPGEKPGEPRVREYFPETFIFEPALITDAHGKATLSVMMPDAITTWRVTAFASSQVGELGSTLSQIRVFQDFFVDIDLPVALTKGDEISIPVALYNYLPRQQKIRLVLEHDDWFEIIEDEELEATLAKDEVSVVYFPIKVNKIGYHSMLVRAYGEVKSDAIKRTISIVPDGKRFEQIISDRIEGDVSKTIAFPDNAIGEANAAFVKIFPGIYSQIVEGLDNLFQMPFGCFEQTTSVTYPNILILDYLRQTEQIKPEIEMAAEEYISIGYQRLLSFEVQSGGFSWFGDAPANRVLTAYGLMEFNDMAKVYEIDERLITRTTQWLKDQQNKDGSWSPDEQYCHAESWTRIQKNEILPTAYICWALADIGEQGSEVSRGLQFLKNNMKAAKDPYILALIANAFVAAEPKSETTTEVLKELVAMAKEQDGAVYWESNIPSVTFSRGNGADIEATGLATYALIKSGKYSDVVSKALTYLIRSKDARGVWYTTQGTVIALRSLVAALGGSAEEVDAQIAVALNGKEIKKLKITDENADLMHQIDLTEFLEKTNEVSITVQGEGNFMYEIVNAYYIPWKELPRPAQPPFTINVDYDRTQLTINDMVDVDVEVRLNRAGTAQMVMVDLGIPPGFEVQTPSLNELVGKKIQKYSLTPRQLIIYLDEVDSKKPVRLSYSIKAKYPIKAKIRASRVYEYYNTSDEGVEEPIEMKVTL
jgi:5-hydroxyisourate hydrolase-like protein (transthyretin family)